MKINDVTCIFIEWISIIWNEVQWRQVYFCEQLNQAIPVLGYNEVIKFCCLLLCVYFILSGFMVITNNDYGKHRFASLEGTL